METVWGGNESTIEETNRLPGPLVVQDGDTSTSVKIHPNLVSPPATWNSSRLVYKQMSIVMIEIPCLGIPCLIWNQQPHLSRLLYKQMSVVLFKIPCFGIPCLISNSEPRRVRLLCRSLWVPQH